VRTHRQAAGIIIPEEKYDRSGKKPVRFFPLGRRDRKKIGIEKKSRSAEAVVTPTQLYDACGNIYTVTARESDEIIPF
jgi:hypothetical protein